MAVLEQQVREVAELVVQSQRVVAFTGAGISTPSGIPDFRSPESGLWDNADPMIVGSIFGFRQNPQAFFDWVHPLAKMTADSQPNPAHYALAKLEQMGKLTSIITQNIDMLHTRAGNQTVFELHGHMREATCIHCFKVYDGEPIMKTFIADGQAPHCVSCNGVLKPNVILFGEELPYKILQSAQDSARDADLFLIAGSSLEVYPANELPLLAHRTGAKIVIINLQATHLDNIAMHVVRDDVANVLPAIVEQLERVE